MGASRGDIERPGYRRAIAAPLYLRHPASLEHDTGAHPERPERIRALEALMESRDWLGWDVQEAPRATEEQLHAVHPPAYVESVREHCEAARPLDGDGDVALDLEGLDAVLSAAAAQLAVEAAGDGDILVEGAPDEA